MKYCKDCQHVTDREVHSLYWGCVKTREIIDNPVSGPYDRFRECYKVRADAEACGPDGKWFEPFRDKLEPLKPQE